RPIIDPFNCGAELTAAALRHLAKQVLGEDAELEPEFFRPAGNREVLLRLQNNIRTRAMQSGGLERAAEVLERMLLIAPEYGRLYRDKAVLETGRGNLQAAVEACTRYQALARNDDEREDAARLLQKLKVRLN
ncbi:MAG TPA: tetratricopeptide repeat protein, partial [Alphaproteobacteria bacterium]|nr:tetratricopeptide repeat protein [Alphaproteobacteria bacterium]